MGDSRRMCCASVFIFTSSYLSKVVYQPLTPPRQFLFQWFQSCGIVGKAPWMLNVSFDSNSLHQKLYQPQRAASNVRKSLLSWVHLFIPYSTFSLRILYMPPVYAVISFFSYRYFRSYTYYALIEVGKLSRQHCHILSWQCPNPLAYEVIDYHVLCLLSHKHLIRLSPWAHSCLWFVFDCMDVLLTCYPWQITSYRIRGSHGRRPWCHKGNRTKG